MSEPTIEKNKPSESPSASGATSPTTANAEQIVKAKRGRPVGSTNGTFKIAGTSGGTANELATRQAELQSQFDALYDPVVWEGLVAAPANIALAYTGSKVWDIPQPEIKALSIQASVTARCFAVSDPKYLALTMLAISIITIYGGRMMQYYSEKAEAKNEKENIPLGAK